MADETPPPPALAPAEPTTPTTPTTLRSAESTPPADPPKKKPWLFQKGNKANPRGRPRKIRRHPQYADLPDGEWGDLTAMKLVWTQGKAEDKTPQERRFREWLDKDIKGFLTHMRGLEEKFQAERTRTPAQQKAADPDEAEARVLGLIDSLLTAAASKPWATPAPAPGASTGPGRAPTAGG
jgi:hypothetical protein